jgi:hypothetical protein
MRSQQFGVKLCTKCPHLLNTAKTSPFPFLPFSRPVPVEGFEPSISGFRVEYSTTVLPECSKQPLVCPQATFILIFMASGSSTVVEYLIKNHEIKGLNPADHYLTKYFCNKRLVRTARSGS